MEKTPNTRSNFCIRPFTQMQIEPDGRISPCCVIRPEKFYFGTGFDDYIKSDRLKRLQKDFLDNKRPKECQVCWDWEDSNLEGTFMRVDDPLPEKPTLNGIHIRFSNICNYKCRMCFLNFSTAWQIENKKHHLFHSPDDLYVPENLFSNPKLRDQLFDEILPTVETISISGGEPLIAPDHLDFLLELIKRKQTDYTISYDTNLSTLYYRGYYFPNLWRQFKEVYLQVSCDGFKQEVEYSRHGFVWSKFVDNYCLAYKYIYGISCITQIHSVYSIPELAVFAAATGKQLSIKPVEGVLRYSVQSLPKKEKIKIVQHYKKFFSSGKLSIEMMEYLRTNVLQYMMNKDITGMEQEFKKHTDSLDLHRNQSFVKTFPQYREWYDSIM